MTTNQKSSAPAAKPPAENVVRDITPLNLVTMCGELPSSSHPRRRNADEEHKRGMPETWQACGRSARMEKNQVEGAVRQAAGRAQGAAGDFLGDAKTQVEGAVREVAGKAQEAYGGAKEMARDAAVSVGRGVEQQPVIALLIAGVVGYVLGLLTASSRR